MARDIDIGFPTVGGLVFQEIQTIASPLTLTAAIQYVYQKTLDRPFYFAGCFLSWDSGTWTNSESITITVDLKVDGTNWENFWTETLTAANAPLTTTIPNIVDANSRRNPQGFWVDGSGIRIGIQQTVEGDGFHVLSHVALQGIPEGGS